MESEKDLADEIEEYSQLANMFKEKGNKAFQNEDYECAIQLYSQGLEIDPDNYVLYSNRSAAYLKFDFKSKALYDAEKCVQLAPNWAKGYNRLGVAQQSLKRYEVAISSFKKSIELDPDTKSNWTALRCCQESYELHKAEKFKKAKEEREMIEKGKKALEKARAEALAAAREEAEKEDLSALFTEVKEQEIKHAVEKEPTPPDEDDLLSDFFSEVTEAKEKVENSAKKAYSEKYMNQDLGSGVDQIARLTGSNFFWKNLNPYYVLQLDMDATDEDIKYRYRKLSARVHPDKNLEVAKAREAFEEVKSAYQKLIDPEQKKNIDFNFEYAVSEAKKDRKKLLQKGIEETTLAPLEEEIKKTVMKLFADIEMQRKRSEKNLRMYNAREKMAEEEVKHQEAEKEVFEKEWSEENRRDKRVNNWREFQEDPAAKKARLANFREEENVDKKKFGDIQLESWRKSWK